MSTPANEKQADAISRRSFLRGKGLSKANTSAHIADHCLALQKVECRSCEDVCPESAIRFKPQLGGQYTPLVDSNVCTSCQECIPICPVSAITISTVDPVEVNNHA